MYANPSFSFEPPMEAFYRVSDLTFYASSSRSLLLPFIVNSLSLFLAQSPQFKDLDLLKELVFGIILTEEASTIKRSALLTGTQPYPHRNNSHFLKSNVIQPT